mmetsp:Transcript_7004/g.21115  ORF Transcript_7004/g.21115 Transcript_7004/m.21115 type:complete len:218 (+) Transcript_7004:831-1484(+)
MQRRRVVVRVQHTVQVAKGGAAPREQRPEGPAGARRQFSCAIRIDQPQCSRGRGEGAGARGRVHLAAVHRGASGVVARARQHERLVGRLHQPREAIAPRGGVRHCQGDGAAARAGCFGAGATVVGGVRRHLGSMCAVARRRRLEDQRPRARRLAGRGHILSSRPHNAQRLVVVGQRRSWRRAQGGRRDDVQPYGGEGRVPGAAVTRRGHGKQPRLGR